MRVVRGRASSPSADRDVTRDLLATVADAGVPAVRAWTPHRHLAFGRRDANEPGYDAARAAAESRGFPSVERSVGGRAVAYTGTTVAFASLEPVDDARRGLDARYDAAVDTVVEALQRFGVDAEPGEPPDSFCPGDHSVQVRGDDGGRKLCGVAQRVTKGAALVGGVVVVADAPEIRAVLTPVYDALDVPFDPRSVGSVADAGGPADPDAVARAIEAAFVGDRPVELESLGDVLDGAAADRSADDATPDRSADDAGSGAGDREA